MSERANIPIELPPLIGQSRPFQELLEHVSRLAPLDRPLLVVGERGTGKELIAARLHYLSRRWDQSFIKLNCAALAENLLESELFGHEAGAFTGAARRRIGRFELADGGTLFLDEIANADDAVQEKILRAVEYGSFERVGGNDTTTVDVRLIAATNVDLRAAAAAGRFRADLLDRLAFDVLTVPPLRARRDDVPLLAEHFGRGMARVLGWPRYPGFAPAAMVAMQDYAWPGNVRELRNVAERAVARWPAADRPVAEVVFDPFESPFAPSVGAGSAIGPATRLSDAAVRTPEAAASMVDASQPMNLRDAVAAFERNLVQQALAVKLYNQRSTARHLGLSYHQLRNTLARLGVRAREAPRPDSDAAN